ncbi:alpha/beta hydrolase [Methylomarinum vadi]|uniref:alpha/beta hydrolase n=1 Tax=Methylomarinum vadi TaxID=438855 RepID=UPI000A027893|nr:alpha/beta hydrolase [Methylomarinum vadi]
MKKKSLALLNLLLISLLLPACAPVVVKPGLFNNQGRLTPNTFITDDGMKLPLSSWQAEQSKAVIIALHGFNDYRQFFQAPAQFFQQHGITSYAYDQRGFGATPNRGYWAGIDAYTNDLALFSRLIKQRHPDTPVYLLGESMGGAVIINTVTQPSSPAIDGIILAAPAVWGRKTMPWYQTALLWSLSYSLPWLTLTGEDLEITASDNIDMLKALGRDPLVIKETRVDAIHGLVNLMDRALENAERLTVDTLLLYGEKDEIIPRRPTMIFLQGLLDKHARAKTIAFYPNGYHMLLRDLQAPVLWRDIAAWISSHGAPLPSGADKHAQHWLKQNEVSAAGLLNPEPDQAHHDFPAPG